MRAYVITDGKALSGGEGFPLLKGESCSLYVNGRPFCTENAEYICRCIKERKETSLFEVGCALGEINALEEEEENPQPASISLCIRPKMAEEVISLIKNMGFSFPLSPHSPAPGIKPDSGDKDGRDKEKGNAVPAGKESPQPAPEKQASPYLRGYVKAGTGNPGKTGTETHMGNHGTGKKKTKPKEGPSPSLGDTPPPYPETLEEAAAFPMKDESGMISRDGQVALFNLAEKGVGILNLSKATGIPRSTISSVCFRIRSGQGSITAEEARHEVETRKTPPASFYREEKNSRPTKNPPLSVPALMAKQMSYDTGLPGIEQGSINGFPLSGNIISDAEYALGYRLSEQDKSVLTNAFFSLRAYEETFIKDLQFGGFSHMDDVPKLKEICTMFEKIRKAKALAKKRKTNG